MQYEQMSLQAAQNEAKRLVETLSYLSKFGGNWNNNNNKENKNNQNNQDNRNKKD
jgi:hypothetical protein